MCRTRQVLKFPAQLPMFERGLNTFYYAPSKSWIIIPGTVKATNLKLLFVQPRCTGIKLSDIIFTAVLVDENVQELVFEKYSHRRSNTPGDTRPSSFIGEQASASPRFGSFSSLKQLATLSVLSTRSPILLKTFIPLYKTQIVIKVPVF